MSEETSTTVISWEQLLPLAERFAQDFAQRHHVFATAESCTGGLISGTITAISGSSQWFDRAFVTYTNEAKMQMLDVQAAILEAFGAVSVQTARQMACGALAHSSADMGTVCIAVARRGEDGAYAFCHHFAGDRMAVRLATVQKALEDLLALSSGQIPSGYEFAIIGNKA